MSCIPQGTISWLSEDSQELEGEECAMRHHVMKLCQQPPHHLQIQALRLLQVSCLLIMSTLIASKQGFLLMLQLSICKVNHNIGKERLCNLK